MPGPNMTLALRAPANPLRQTTYIGYRALFFAYRGFTGDPDRILNEIGLGAHTIACCILSAAIPDAGRRSAGILQITKQSLARVLRELIKEVMSRSVWGRPTGASGCFM